MNMDWTQNLVIVISNNTGHKIKIKICKCEIRPVVVAYTKCVKPRTGEAEKKEQKNEKILRSDQRRAQKLNKEIKY